MLATCRVVCRAAVAETLARWRWGLVRDRAEFIEGVCAELVPRFDGIVPLPVAQLQQAARAATFRRYGALLYAACGQWGTRAQNAAYEELGRYLYSEALYKTGDAGLAREAAQQALVNIVGALGQCRDPRAFLNWGKRILLNALSDIRRAQRRWGWEGQARERVGIGESEFDLEDGAGTAAPDSVGADDPELDPYEHAVRSQRREQLVAALRACLKNERQVRVVVRVLLDNLTHSQVAEEMGSSALNVQVTKSRAMTRLKECEQLYQLFEQWIKQEPRRGEN